MLLINPYRFASTFDAAAAQEAAENYIAAVEAADGQSLEVGVVTALEDFIIGLHQDGIWDAIKASCILAGARTLSGALVPLVGTGPTNFNFVSADYNRETGLKGNGSTKYLNSNRAENSDPLNNVHLSFNLTQHIGGGGRVIMGALDNTLSPLRFTQISDNYVLRARSNIGYSVSSLSTPTFAGISRNNSANFQTRIFSSNATTNAASLSHSSFDYFIFARNNTGTVSLPIAHRLSFYSIGEDIDLTALNTRVSTLMTDLAAAI